MQVVTDFSHVRLRDRPLVVCDIDEVVLEFLSPFTDFLRSHNYDLLPRSFRLHGNIVSLLDGSEMDRDSFSSFQDEFFASQNLWQKPAERAIETLHALAEDADIVFLTAMPPRHQGIRRALLDEIGLDFAMIASEEAKGPIVAKLHARRALPVAFIDDIQRNLLSVAENVPECFLISMMANADFRQFAPPPVGAIVSASGWDQAGLLMKKHFAGG